MLFFSPFICSQKVIISALFKSCCARLSISKENTDNFELLEFVNNENLIITIRIRAKDVIVFVKFKMARTKSQNSENEKNKSVSLKKYTIQHRRINELNHSLYHRVNYNLFTQRQSRLQNHELLN